MVWMKWKLYLCSSQNEGNPLSNLMVRSKALPLALIFIIICTGLISTASNNKTDKLVTSETRFSASAGVFESFALRPNSVSKEIKTGKQDLSLITLSVSILELDFDTREISAKSIYPHHNFFLASSKFISLQVLRL